MHGSLASAYLVATPAVSVCPSPPPLPLRQVRYDQLMRQQEKMIQDMEKAVYRREAIMLRSELIHRP